MKFKPTNLREKASHDVDQIIEYYLTEANGDTALSFINALERGFKHVGRHPKSGSTFYAHELNWPGLKSWSLKRYPYLVFYLEQTEFIEAIRVLHNQRDIPRWMRESEE